MDIIQLLPENIANQIAAGEVIQRPSSAIKEMLENSIDSGADKIEIFIKDAGKTLLQVVDNGCGMSISDAKMCIKRHATSKIKNIEDLYNIKTMGFRGEAMSSISAISHIEICTKIKSEELGSKILIESSKIINEEQFAMTNGTSIKIKNLFFNVPARRKFLKSDLIENKHIKEEIYRISLANPNIYWSLTVDGKEIIKLPGSNYRQRIVNLFGNKINEQLVPINEETNIVKINGFVGKPEIAKKRRGEQFFFVNSRFIKNHYLNHAVNKAFSELIPEKYNPTYFINIEIDPKKIDVNIHPTKTEIKFDDEQYIYAILRSCIKKSLGEYNIAPTLNFNTEPAFEIPITKNYKEIKPPKIKIDTKYNPFGTQEKYLTNDIYKKNNDLIQSSINIELEEDKKTSSNCFQFNLEYIVYTKDKNIIVINQQRAHQRILYEYYKKKHTSKLISQKLLFPKKIQLSTVQINEIKENNEKLEKIGFTFDINNKNEISFYSIPHNLIEEDLTDLFDDFLQKEDVENNLKEKIFTKICKKLSTIQCVKKGQSLKISEMTMIITELNKCEISSMSPFGMPIYFNISIEDISKNFK